eukprot:snap_masked-scaffold_43-processed-gene-1.68-mRNA-1 protein AED:1.00 eAED:1.00 QI:0/0/0/0/1/1/2/0/147
MVRVKNRWIIFYSDRYYDRLTASTLNTTISELLKRDSFEIEQILRKDMFSIIGILVDKPQKNRQQERRRQLGKRQLIICKVETKMSRLFINFLKILQTGEGELLRFQTLHTAGSKRQLQKAVARLYQEKQIQNNSTVSLINKFLDRA